MFGEGLWVGWKKINNLGGGLGRDFGIDWVVWFFWLGGTLRIFCLGLFNSCMDCCFCLL